MNLRRIAFLLLVAPALGCAAKRVVPPAPTAEPRERAVVREATLHLRVRSLVGVATAVEVIAREAQGHVVTEHQRDNETLTVSLRVPAENLGATLERLGQLGRVRGRTLSARDVTDEVVDQEARLRNKQALRERLRELLRQTAELKDVLAVEEQLARVQTEIDVLEARLTHLRTSVSYAQVTVSVERARRPGPLAYIVGGLFWALGKLFVMG